MSERSEMPKGASLDGLRREATLGISTSHALPPSASNSDFSGQFVGDNQASCAAEGDVGNHVSTLTNEIDGRTNVETVNGQAGATNGLTTGQAMPLPASLEFGGLNRRENQTHPAAKGDASNGSPPTPANPWLVEQCDILRALQRQRQFCIVSQSRCDRSCESFIARVMGFNPEAPEKERKELFFKASSFRKKVEKGADGDGHSGGNNHSSDAISVCVPIILNSQKARQAWDALRLNTEKEMRRIARTLPAYAWVEAVRGFGDLGFAIIIGETGDLANYATKERVWKRLGLAVIEGQRQQKRTNAEDALKHGYSPKRRAEVWTIADSLFRAQWRGAKGEGEEAKAAYPLGPYGEAYAYRKARTADREGWTPAHRDNDARRIMTKFLLENLWRVWNGKAELPPPSIEKSSENSEIGVA